MHDSEVLASEQERDEMVRRKRAEARKHYLEYLRQRELHLAEGDEGCRELLNARAMAPAAS